MTLKLKLPLFITFEGGEGAGKTSLMNALAEYLYQQGFTPVLTRQPGGTRLGEEIRHLLLHPTYGHKIAPKTELLLFLAARAQNVEEVILPSLKDDKIILCDRFHDSTIAYQGFAQNLGESEVEALSLYSADGLKPDLTIYLDVEPSVGLKRAKEAIKELQEDRIEAKKLEFHEKVRSAFLHMAKREPKRFKIINAHLPKKQVFEQAVAFLENL